MSRLLETVLTGLAVLLTGSVALAKPPNVVVLVADDQGWGDLSCHGNTNLSTPRLDGLAAAGASFRRFYVQPVCAPTRAEFLTGRYHPRVGVSGVSEGRERLDPDCPTIANLFQQAGYSTAAFGKWHNGTQAPYHPLCRGFDRFYGFTSGHWGHYFDFWLDRDGSLVKGKGFLPDDLTGEAIEFIKRNRERPFFAYVAYNTPHSPMQVPDRWWKRHDGQHLERLGSQDDREDHQHTRAALAMGEDLDWNVGRILGQLETLGLSDDTIVVYFSDNGPNGHRWNNRMRGIKGSVDEGGVRSPLFIRWPHQITPGRVVECDAAAIDLLPTLTDLASIKNEAGASLDGVSLAADLLGNPKENEPRVLFSHWGSQTAARDGRYVLDAQGRLYDLHQDPGQKHDLAATLPQVAKRLSSQVADWSTDVGLNRPKAASPFTVGHPAMATTQLPARDAIPHGAVARSNRYPNCSYFSGWRTPDDHIDWDVEVLTAGSYEATVYLSASADQAEFELVMRRGGEVQARRSVAPLKRAELLGPQHDRVLRGESYVMDFQPYPIGKINLPAGRQTLTISVSPPSISDGPAIWLLSLERASVRAE